MDCGRDLYYIFLKERLDICGMAKAYLVLDICNKSRSLIMLKILKFGSNEYVENICLLVVSIYLYLCVCECMSNSR